MRINEKSFFSFVRSRIFAGKLTQGVVDTINGILKCYRENGRDDIRDIAYILATAYYESYSAAKNPNWLPVREGWAKTNEGAIRAVTSLFEKGIISKNYAIPDEEGKSWYGRGYVQITWKENYRRLGDAIGVDLVANPDLALDREVSINILVIGMVKGLFTGKKLADYLTPKTTDYANARRIINGTDRALPIASKAYKFYQGLNS